jgi:hypothetical protein
MLPNPTYPNWLGKGNREQPAAGSFDEPMTEGLAGHPKNPRDCPRDGVAEPWSNFPGNAPKHVAPRSTTFAFPVSAGAIGDMEEYRWRHEVSAGASIAGGRSPRSTVPRSSTPTRLPHCDHVHLAAQHVDGVLEVVGDLANEPSDGDNMGRTGAMTTPMLQNFLKHPLKLWNIMWS